MSSGGVQAGEEGDAFQGLELGFTAKLRERREQDIVQEASKYKLN